MPDVATLRVEVDSRAVEKGEMKLTTFVGASKRAESATVSLGRVTSEAAAVQEKRNQATERGQRAMEADRRAQEVSARRMADEEQMRAESLRRLEEAEVQWQAEKAAREAQVATETVDRSQQAARDSVSAMEQVFQADMARIKEAMARGMMTKAEAAQAGRDAASDYNRGVLEVLDQTEGIRAQRSGAVFTEIAGSLKHVDNEGQRAGASMGRLNQTLVSHLRQVTQTSPAVGQLANVIGSMALGGAIMTGVLAGLAALAIGWRRITEDAREARKAQEGARESLERVIETRRVASLGPGGAIQEDAQKQRDRMAELERRIQAERASLATSGVTGIDSPRIERMQREYDELLEIVRGGEEAIRELRNQSLAKQQLDFHSQQRLAAASEAGDEELERVTNQLRRESDLRVSVAGAVGEEREAIIRLVNARHDLIASMQETDRASRDEKDAAREAAQEAERQADTYRRAREVSENTRTGLVQEIADRERVLEAYARGAEAVEAEERAVARATAIRQASTTAIASQRVEIEAMAGALFDLGVAEQEAAAAAAAAQNDASAQQQLADVQALAAMTLSFVGTLEELEAAQTRVRREQEMAAEVQERLAGGTALSEAAIRKEIQIRNDAVDAIVNETRSRGDLEAVQARAASRAGELDDLRRLVEIHSRYSDETEGLTEAVTAYNRAMFIRNAVEAELRQNKGADTDALKAQAGEMFDLAQKLKSFGEEGEKAAVRWETAMLSAAGRVNDGVGGVMQSLLGSLSQVGGALGTAAGVGAMIVGLVGGGGRDRTREAEEQRRMADEAGRAADALRELTRSVRDDLGTRRLVIDGLNEEAERRRQSLNQRDERESFLSGLPYGQAVDLGTRSMLEGVGGWSPEELEAQVDLFRAIGSDYGNAVAAWIEMAWVQAREQEALAAEQAHRAEEAAERRRQEEERQAAFSVETDANLGAREASLWGTDSEAFIAAAEAVAIAERNRVDAMLRAGEISEEQAHRWFAVIDGEFTRAVDGFAESVKASTEATRMAQEQAMQSLDLRYLIAQGMDEEAFAMRQNLEMRKAIADGYDEEYLDFLAKIQEIERTKRSEGPEVEPGGAARRAATDVTRRVGSITTSQADNLLSVNWSQLSRLDEIALNTRSLRGDGVSFSPGTAGSRSGGVSQVFSVTLSFPNVTELSEGDARAAGEALNRVLGQRAREIAVSAGAE